MLVTGGPPASATESAGLHVVRARRRSFAGSATFLRDPAHRAKVGAYLSDMVRPYGLSMSPDQIGDGPPSEWGQSYGEMAEALIGDAVTGDEPVDLLILAYAMHDLRPGRATATFLSSVCPGSPVAFAICDQGSAAMFTAARVAGEYAAGAACRRALLIAVEQSKLPYPVAAPAVTPAEHRGVALLCDATAIVTPAAPPARPRLRVAAQHADVAPDRVAGLIGAAIDAELDQRPNARLVLSGALARLWDAPGHDALVANVDQPMTGVWWELGGPWAELPESPESSTPSKLSGRVPMLLGDYDPDLRYLCLAAIDG